MSELFLNSREDDEGPGHDFLRNLFKGRKFLYTKKNLRKPKE